MGGVDVAEHPAGAGGGALPVVPDQQHPPAPAGDEADGGVQLRGRRQPGLVDDDQRVRADLGDPLRAVGFGVSVSLVDQFVQGVGVHLVQRARAVPPPREACGARPTTCPPVPCQARASTPITVVFPVPAGARARCTRRPLVATSVTICGLPVVQGAAAVVGRPFQHRDLHIGRGDPPPVGAPGGVHEALFGVQHRR